MILYCLIMFLACGPKPNLTPEEAEKQGRTLFMEHIAAIGGMTTLQNHQSIRTEGTIQYIGDPIAHSFLEIKVRPNHFYRRLRIHEKGVFERGFNGDKAWSLTPQSGPLVSSKRQSKLVEREADFDDLINHQLWYPELIDIGEEIYGDRPCHALQTKNHLGDPEILYFDREHKWLLGRVISVNALEPNVWIRYGQYVQMGDMTVPIMKEEITDERHSISMSSSVRWDVVSETPTIPKAVERLLNESSK